MKSEKKKQQQHVTPGKRDHRKIQEQELAAARKKASIAKAKLEQAKAEQEAARVEAEAIAAKVEAKRVLEELKEVKNAVQLMTTSNKKKQEQMGAINGFDAKGDLLPFNQEFNLKVKEDQTFVSEITDQMGDYSVTNKDQNNIDGEEGACGIDVDGCGIDYGQLDNMMQSLLSWFMGDDDQDAETAEDSTYKTASLESSVI